VDAFDVITPGRRYEDTDASIVYVGNWTRDNEARVWSEGRRPRPTFRHDRDLQLHRHIRELDRLLEEQRRGCAKVYIDGVLQKEIRLGADYPSRDTR
jgi:hypothetical protein